MDRYKETKYAGILGILGNIFLLIIKATIGIITRSQAMIADSANSASDVFASFMTYIGNKIASEPQDDSHNFGHGKAEYIFSMFISISMIILGIKILTDSIVSLILNEHMEFSWGLVIVCVVTIIIKFLLYLYTNKLSRKHDNILLIANRDDHRNDCLVTSFTLISVLATLVNIYWLDGIVGIGISIWIVYTGIKIFIESFNTLMDKSLDEVSKKDILDIIEKNSDVKEIKNISSIPVGHQYIVVITICVDGKISTFDSHNLADKLEKEISELNKVYNTIVHVEPV